MFVNSRKKILLFCSVLVLSTVAGCGVDVDIPDPIEPEYVEETVEVDDEGNVR
jgi:hypothetical protein